MCKTLNDRAWEELFDTYHIIEEVNSNGSFEISASQIRELREPRLMTKFDHGINLPRIFSDNNLAILPITRGSYLISRFNAYHVLEPDENTDIVQKPLPQYLQSIDSRSISSEAVALSCAFASGIISDFLDDEEIVPTVFGRMGSGTFEFDINSLADQGLNHICVRNSQIEIDAAYEGIDGLALFEAKRDLSEDFLVRQLYYPYRTWKERVTKRVRPIFMIYSNGIFKMYEYCFQEPNNYNSLILMKQKNYSVEDTTITIEDIQSVLNSVVLAQEPQIPFPQADSFDRVINLCELLSQHRLNRNEVTERYAFDERQTNYYTDAARYLNLIEKYTENGTPYYQLTETGRRILRMGYKDRQLEYCKLILSHQVFKETLNMYLESGIMPSKRTIMLNMQNANLFNINSESTLERRSSTIKGWINWIISLINE